MYTLTALFPYVGFMVASFDGAADDEDAADRAGVCSNKLRARPYDEGLESVFPILRAFRLLLHVALHPSYAHYRGSVVDRGREIEHDCDCHHSHRRQEMAEESREQCNREKANMRRLVHLCSKVECTYGR